MPADTPIAIVGIGCRFPGGATSPARFWDLVRTCADGVSEVPRDRWAEDFFDPDPRTPGTSYTARGGYLDDPGRAFDAGFFGISPREAETLDPQQRLLLEVSYEALEDAGLPLEGLRGSRTGVFVGGFTLDNMLLRFSELTAVDAHTATSSSMTVLSNRISYTFDLRGPSMTIDTACSSSLVATHLACRSLRAGECELALVGGVNVILLPSFQVVMCKGRFLAPDGRSKAFDAAADGYGRGEGAGVVVLKPLSRALADGDRVYAVLRGTGVNQDGATDGMPQPSGPAQAALFRETCARAGVDPARVGYIEAHGTGTALGDPTEVGALGEVYGRPGDPSAPRLGSVKPNIGHLEAAAGIAGLIKATLVVHHATLPPHWRPERVNPALRLDDAGLVLPFAPEPWTTETPSASESETRSETPSQTRSETPSHTRSETPSQTRSETPSQTRSETPQTRIAVVNSFGYGGTNAHAVLEQAPPAAGPTGGQVRAVPLSAVGEPGLRARAGQLARTLAEGAALPAVAGALAHRRSQLPTRAVVLASEPSIVTEALAALADGRRHPAVVGPEAPSASVAWLYTGMGPQWWAMGAQLYASEPAFREGLEVAAAALARHGCPVRPELFLDRQRSRMARNDVAQPANFVVQVGLTVALREAGLRPAVIIGHSTGEMAAAWAAGALDLDDAARVVATRARLQQEVAGGGMLAVALSPAAVRPHLDRIGGIEIAAFNADDSVTLAGDTAALDALAAELHEAGTWCARVRVEVAYHSAHMDPIGGRLRAALAALAPRAPATPLISTVTGQGVTGPTHDADYWWRNTRGAVRLADAVRSALDLGVDAVLEVGPHPVLAPSVQSVAKDRISTSFALRREEPEAETFARAVASLYVRGAAVRPTFFADDARADLPAWPWQRDRLWREPAAAKVADHPLLRAVVDGAFTCRLDRSALSWLRDHRVRGAAILPGAAFVEAARAAAAEALGGAVGTATPAGEVSSGVPAVDAERPRRSDEPMVVLTDVALDRALALEEPGTAQWLRTEVRDGQVTVSSRAADGAWTAHATARIEEARRWRALGRRDPAELRARCAQEVEVGPLYEAFARRGLEYGPAFQGVSRLWRGEGEVVAELRAPTTGASPALVLHPALLDAAFQALLAVAGDGRTLLPVHLDRVQAAGALPAELLVHGRIRSDDGEELVGDVELLDLDGAVLAKIVGLRCRSLTRATSSERWWHEEVWVPSPAAPAVPGGASDPAPQRVVWTAPTSTDPVGADLAERLLEQVRACVARGVGLDVCTRGALAVDGSGGDPAQAALWGLARVARTEHPELGLRLIDLDPRGDDAPAVVAALAAADGEEEVAIRGAVRRVARLRRRPPEGPAAEPTVRRVPAGSVGAALVAARPGSLDSLVFVPAPRPAPGPGEVEIEVEAAPLNFKDVMKAMGMLDEVALEATYLGGDLGMEAVGRVCRAGEGVELAVGQRVLVYKGGTLRTHVVADQRFVVPCPEAWSAGDAASFFVTVTAWHALVDVARVREGETVLVHSAAGGVGLAALGVARRLGARVIATAGTEAKRAFLRSQGVEQVLDSRTLDWADEVAALTGGRGVDVVLNSLGGRAIDLGLGCLAPGGRFVELGKRDLAAGRLVSLRAFNRRTALLAVDLDRAAGEDPDGFPPLARAVLDELASGRLAPLPSQVHACDGVVDAFRALGSGGLIGKVAVQLRHGTMALADGLGAGFAPRPGRPWLVTGGLGGFGLATAAWLVDRGVTWLVLASRRGEARGEEAAIIAGLRRRGVRVDEVALDAADAAAVEDLVAGLPDLGGVVHAAALLDDAPVDRLSADALRRTLDAKARGAWNLHRATEGRDLEAFVLYSSISARVGNPGQPAYGAANLALEGLAALRRARGLPATAVAWGVIDEVGMVARDTSTGAHLRSVGLRPMAPGDALDALGVALAEGRAQVALVDIDWAAWVRAHAGVSWRRLEELREQESSLGGLAEVLAALPEAERLDRALACLAEAAAPVFGLEVERLEVARPLRDLGLDSLMAVELAGALGRAAGIEVSAMDLLGGRSLLALAQRLVGGAAPARPAGSAASGAGTAEAGRSPAVVPAPAATGRAGLAKVAERPPLPEGEGGGEGTQSPSTEVGGAPVAKQPAGRDGSAAPASATDSGAVARALRERILLTAPYDRLEALRLVGEEVWAEVQPDVLDTDLGPIAAAEAGRHLAILGSMATSLRNPDPERHEYAVAAAELALDEVDGAPAARVSLRARCTSFDRAASRATAEGELYDLDGRRLATLRVSYHVLPVRALHVLFADHLRPTPETGEGGPDPYRNWRPAPVRAVVGEQVITGIDRVPAASCAGHFPGLPALPVSIVGREVFAAVAEAMRRASGDPELEVSVRGAALETRRFVWADEDVSFVASPDGTCEVRAGGEVAATFRLDVLGRSHAQWKAAS